MTSRTPLTIRHQPIAALQLDPRNPRIHTPRQIRQIANSIESFGFNVPVLVDHTGKILAGHGRVLACQKLGWDNVPTIELAHLTPEQARAFAIADNRLTEISSWDDALLAESLRELAAVELDFDIEATGFTMGEIDLRIDESLSAASGQSDPADRLPAIADGPAISELGDVWQLGRHRLVCGNALDPRHLRPAIGGQAGTDGLYRPALQRTDPRPCGR
jgi:ParB-like chromosome segregation protein Spo0J